MPGGETETKPYPPHPHISDAQHLSIPPSRSRQYQDIGAIIEDHVTPLGYTTVKSFCGHGIGTTFHTTPNILHYRNAEPAGTMEAGHVFTIEPMICQGTNQHVTWPDEWTAATKDGGWTAQFEHTLLITEDGAVPLTGKVEGQSMVQPWEGDGGFFKGAGE